MAFSDILSKPNWEKIFITETLLGHRVDGDVWIQHGVQTNCWYIEHNEGVVVAVHERDTEYSEEANLVNLNANPEGWFYDTSETPPRLYVHTTDSDDPATADKYIILASFWEYICSSQDEDDPVVYNSQYYLPYLDSDTIPNITLEVAEYFKGGAKQSFGSVKYINTDGYFDQRLADYVYENRLIYVRVTYRGAPLGDVATLWVGWTGGIHWTENEVEIEIEDYRSK